MTQSRIVVRRFAAGAAPRMATAAEVRAIAARMTARMAALERRWVKSGGADTQALLGGLIFCQLQLPPWLFAGLCQRLEKQLPREPWPYHGVRWSMVEGELAHNPKLKVRQACENVSKRLAAYPARGSAGAIERSYYLFKGQQARRRPHNANRPT